jgi:membrane protein DedA with SNARE-associated domain
MNAIFYFALEHGYWILFAATFAHQIGLPLPGPLFLVSAGALAAAGKLGVLPAIALAVTACVLADWVWYEAGRRGGDKVLHFIHRFTRDPDFHDRRAKRVFARYGLPLLLLARFVPGVDALAPPIAGISRTSRVRFLTFDAAGAGLYAVAYGGLGYLFSKDLDRAAAYASRAGRLLIGLALVGVGIYIAYKLVQRHRVFRESRIVPNALVDSTEFGDSVDMPCGVVGGRKHGN